MIRHLHRAALRTTAGPGRHVWNGIYRLAARAACAYLTRGIAAADASVERGVGHPDFVPLVSDVDLHVVTGDPDSAGLVRARYGRLVRLLPPARCVFDLPTVVTRAEHERIAASTCLTFALDEAAPGAAYGPEPGFLDRIRPLERPRLAGGPQRVAERPRAIVAWLNLLWTWRLAFPACADPGRPHVPFASAKLVADPLRILLWLEQGEAVPDRRRALALGRRAYPEEAEAFELAAATLAALPRSPQAPLSAALPCLIRLSARIAALVERETTAAGSVDVRLAVDLDGAPSAGPGAPLAAADWRSIVCPGSDDLLLVRSDAQAADPVVLGALAASQADGAYDALCAGDLVLLPSVPLERTRMRAVSTAVTEPALHALLAGARAARYPQHPGWSIGDVARRAVAEHRHALASGDVGRLLAAARAALLDESVRAGSPVLPVTAAATARILAERSTSARAVADSLLDAGGPAPGGQPGVARALRSLVAALPAFRRR